MHECKTPDVPSFSALRKKQAELTKNVNIKTTHHVSAMGNEFYMNHPAELLALDWANPLVREFIQVYPEITDRISELRQADKWTKEVDFDDLSPMWADWKRAGHKHFYIKELAQLQNSAFVIPIGPYFNVYLHWIILIELYGKSGYFIIHNETMIRVRATDFKYNYLDLKESGYSLKFPESSPEWAQSMPNPVRKIAKGRPVFSMRIIPWSNDVSGNVSKQFNPHMNVCIANANLPHRKVSQEYFVRFCSTSPHASSGEQFEAVAEDLGCNKYHKAYDCKLEQEILFRIFAHVLPADNPQQAESASNAGVHANLWCRYDGVGGTAAHRETDEGYHALFKPGIARTPAQTIRIIKRQILTGVKDKTALFWIEKLIIKARETQKERFRSDPRLKDKNLKGDAHKAVKIRIKDLIQWELYSWVILQPEERYSKLPRHSGIHRRPGDHYNILLRVRGIDPHQDSPCEILHSVLLGVDKYIWHETNTAWDKPKAEKFAVRLQSSSTSGLNMPSLRGRYIVKYKNALIGKHFKILQQLGAFHLHEDICGKNLFELWKASGELGAMLWYPEIRNLEQYLSDLQICIDNVLDLWGLIDPARILTKYKLHVLSHLPDDIRCFGPAILFAAEGFECWNAIFRLCSILSNHQAPSHDIGVTLADMECFKHQVSGGWWKAAESDQYVQAGPKVISFLGKNMDLQRRLGWMDKSRPKPDEATTAPWRDILGPLWALELDARGAGKIWTTCKYVVSHTGDICPKQSWVFFKCKNTDTILAGCICNIVIPVTASTQHNMCVVLVRQFVVSATRDERMNMPVLSPFQNTHLVEPENILFCFNAQHDCVGSNCQVVTDGERIMQEHQTTGLTQAVIHHKETEIYFINMHALHNAHLLRETLPRTKHSELAGLRAATAQKSRETREKKKQAKEAGLKELDNEPELAEEDEEDEPVVDMEEQMTAQ
ncbi:hypothetical protein B0H14DRAFT_3646238 [Mycena olivaceomarginata]|nr:hypothetical protein B0H14DRAFT_3646238 [Mycena olivaceomarginata]